MLNYDHIFIFKALTTLHSRKLPKLSLSHTRVRFRNNIVVRQPWLPPNRRLSWPYLFALGP